MPTLPRKVQKGDKIAEVALNTVNGIIDYLNSAWIIGDNRTIQTNSMNGQVMISSMTKSKSGGGSASIAPADEYKGYFAIVPDYDNDCYMCGNNNYDDIHITGIAGYVYFGYYTRNVAPLFGIQTGDYVWLECFYNGSDYVGELKHGLESEMPEGTPDLNVQIIGYITPDDLIVQVQKGIYDLRFLLM